MEAKGADDVYDAEHGKQTMKSLYQTSVATPDHLTGGGTNH